MYQGMSTVDYFTETKNTLQAVYTTYAHFHNNYTGVSVNFMK